jgi:hypothetical protein
MPYKVEGRSVYVFKNGHWQLLKRHASKEAARRHWRALEANVKHK